MELNDSVGVFAAELLHLGQGKRKALAQAYPDGKIVIRPDLVAAVAHLPHSSTMMRNVTAK